MSNEVMACPLCGDSGFIKVVTRCKPEGEWEARMKCEECGIELIKSGETEDAAITALLKAWNTRAERTCHPVPKYGDDSPWPVMVCSECGRPLHYDEHREMDYQPYCGCGAKVVE